MRQMIVGAAAGAVLVMGVAGLLGQPSEVLAQRPQFDPSAELITSTMPVGDAYQQLTVIDPRSRVLSVYHIELASGEVSLKSVRNIHWDLQMSEFNGVSPLPQDIRTLLESR